MLEDEQIGGPDTEEHRRVAVDAIEKAPPPAEADIFVDRHRRHVADAAALEIADAGVVAGVGAAPQIVRRQRHDADHPTDPVVGGAPAEEGAVAAIVLDHEEPHQEAASRN